MLGGVCANKDVPGQIINKLQVLLQTEPDPARRCKFEVSSASAEHQHGCLKLAARLPARTSIERRPQILWDFDGYGPRFAPSIAAV
jgi:hypothetical protein